MPFDFAKGLVPGPTGSDGVSSPSPEIAVFLQAPSFPERVPGDGPWSVFLALFVRGNRLDDDIGFEEHRSAIGREKNAERLCERDKEGR